MPELNPVTRRRLLYIAVFLAFDAVAALFVSSTIDPANTFALPAIIFGLISAVGAGSLGSFLYATRPVDKDLRAARSRE